MIRILLSVQLAVFIFTVFWMQPKTTMATNIHSDAILFLTTPSSWTGDQDLAPEHPIYSDSITFIEQGIVHDTPADPYLINNYVPTVMYDETENLYKVWSCAIVSGDDPDVNIAMGDHIVYKQSPTLAGLASAPWSIALEPRNQVSGAFDGESTCDPSVIRVQNHYYLYYGGYDPCENPHTTRIGVAVSSNGGRTFTRLNGGQPILEMDAPQTLYGVGQPSVVKAPDGYYYMMYSDIFYNNAVCSLREDIKYMPLECELNCTTDPDPTYQLLHVIRSRTPLFDEVNQEDIITMGAHLAGVSINLAYNVARGEFVVAANPLLDNDSPIAALVHFDHDFQRLGMTIYNPPVSGFRFSEGIAVIRNSIGELHREFNGNRAKLTFIGDTANVQILNQGGEEAVQLNPRSMRYMSFEEGANGVVTNFSQAGDLAVDGDIDGDGRQDIIVWRPANAYWYIKKSTENFADVHDIQWGNPGDWPLTVNYDNDVGDELAVWRLATSSWLILTDDSRDGRDWPDVEYERKQWGRSGDWPVVLNYDTNDATDELAVWRPSTGHWLILTDNERDGRDWPNVDREVEQWGLAADVPTPLLDDSTGKENIAVMRPATGELLVMPLD